MGTTILNEVVLWECLTVQVTGWHSMQELCQIKAEGVVGTVKINVKHVKAGGEASERSTEHVGLK